MNAANDITAIRARLPYLDRRALSQAWYSALHLASDGATASVKHAFAICELASDGRLPAATDSSHESHARLPLAGRALSRRPEAGGATSPANVARHAKRAGVPLATTRRYPPVRATFTLHVVALCTRRHVELVRRALACADFALRAEGERVQCSLRATEGTE